MVIHIVDPEKCKGCGKCVEACGLELWMLVEIEGGKKKRAHVVEEAPEICHCCLCCQDACPEGAISVKDEAKV
jgi:NAD-dependent dihydropyrimidine dehydrogenase PreA subunit